jgi:hypothetical protein
MEDRESSGQHKYMFLDEMLINMIYKNALINVENKT